jgi:hypothetical protein
MHLSMYLSQLYVGLRTNNGPLRTYILVSYNYYTKRRLDQWTKIHDEYSCLQLLASGRPWHAYRFTNDDIGTDARTPCVGSADATYLWLGPRG